MKGDILDLHKEYGFSNRTFSKQIRVPIAKKYITALFMVFETERSIRNRIENYRNHFTLFKSTTTDSIVVIRVETSIKHVDIDAVLMTDHITVTKSAKSGDACNWVISYDEIEYSSETPNLTDYRFICSGEWWYFDRGVILNGISAFSLDDPTVTSTFIYYELHPDYTDYFNNCSGNGGIRFPALGGIPASISSTTDLINFNMRTVTPFMAQFFGPPRPISVQQNNLFSTSSSGWQRPLPSSSSLPIYPNPFNSPLFQPPPPPPSSTFDEEQQQTSSSPQEVTTTPSPPPLTTTTTTTTTTATTNNNNAPSSTTTPISFRTYTPQPISRIVIPGNLITSNNVTLPIQNPDKSMSVVPSIYWFAERKNELCDNDISYFLPYDIVLSDDAIME